MDENARKEYWASLALRHCRHIGARTQFKLLVFFGSALDSVENVRQWPEAGVNSACMEEFGSGRWRISAKKEWDEAATCDADILLWTNKQYPGHLREIADAPMLLYCKGDASLLKGPGIALVGSRNATSKSLGIAHTLANSISAAGITVVSGMALGIDAQAHAGALESLGKSIGVLGTGIMVEYPVSNRQLYAKMKEQGLLISEFPPTSPPTAVNFPIRNRIISGLSLGVVVVEAAVRSGSLITAQQAIEQNREVFAVPGEAMSNQSAGCQNLLRQGAHPVFSPEDVLCELADRLRQFGNLITLAPPSLANPRNSQDFPDLPDLPDLKMEQEPGINCEPDFEGSEIVGRETEKDNAKRILACLRDSPKHVDKLALELNLDVNEVNSNLIFLEMIGKIRRMPGAVFSISQGH